MSEFGLRLLRASPRASAWKAERSCQEFSSSIGFSRPAARSQASGYEVAWFLLLDRHASETLLAEEEQQPAAVLDAPPQYCTLGFQVTGLRAFYYPQSDGCDTRQATELVWLCFLLDSMVARRAVSEELSWCSQSRVLERS